MCILKDGASAHYENNEFTLLDKFLFRLGSFGE